MATRPAPADPADPVRAAPFDDRLAALVHGPLAEAILDHCRRAYAKLTAAERARFLEGAGPARGPKVLALAVLDSDLAEREIGAESARGDVRRLRQLLAKRF